MRRTTPRRARNWIRNPRASARWLGTAVRWHMRGAVSVDCGDGLRLRCHPESARTFGVFLQEPDSQAELAEFRALARPGMRLYDVGAHYGFFSLAALALGGPRARVLAVEPSPRAGRILEANLKLTAAGARARAVHAAAGPGDGLISMISGGVNSEHYMYIAEAQRPDAATLRQYGLPGLECLCGWQPTHLKLDVESFEYEMLTSEENLIALSTWRPILFLELHCEMIRKRGHAPEVVLQQLARRGYRGLLHHGKPITPEAAVALPVARLRLEFAERAAL